MDSVELQSFSIPEHWGVPEVPHKVAQMYANGAEQWEADTPKQDNVMCYPEERQNEQKTISLGIQWINNNLCLLINQMYTTVFIEPWSRRLKYIPDTLPVKEQFV